MSDNTPLSITTNNSSIQPLIREKISTLDHLACTTNFSDYLIKYVKHETGELSQLFPDAVPVISRFLKLSPPLLLINSRYWQTAKQLLNQVIPSTTPVNFLLNYNKESLFGRISTANEQQLIVTDGQLKKCSHGVLVLNISPLLVDPALWFMLKAVLQRGHLEASDAVNAEKIKTILPDFSKQKIQPKIILVASRLQLEELIQIDPEYSQVSSLFCELASQIPVSQSNINAMISYFNHTSRDIGLSQLNDETLTTLLNFLATQCQHQNNLLFSPELIKETLLYAALFNEGNEVTAADLNNCFKEKEKAQSLPRQFSEQSLLEGQINLQLSGEKIGQINGLSVVELLGYPCEFGEVFRVSASDMIGDGEIIDVERKVELAGNIHAKSTLIVQGYINHFFSHINTFPYSCNLVFEQSYQESDGDSASLAILIAVTSCYAKTPIKQNVFVTGSLDQHGNVLAIGGINQKIESVCRLFELGVITETVSIIMPAANKINLTLNAATLALIKSGKILIHPISHCHEAYPLLLDKTFEETVEAINQRIETAVKEELGELSNGLFSRILNFLFR